MARRERLKIVDRPHILKIIADECNEMVALWLQYAREKRDNRRCTIRIPFALAKSNYANFGVTARPEILRVIERVLSPPLSSPKLEQLPPPQLPPTAEELAERATIIQNARENLQRIGAKSHYHQRDENNRNNRNRQVSFAKPSLPALIAV